LRLHNSYGGLFGTKEQGEEIAQVGVDGFIERWGWFHVLDEMSNNNRDKWDYFLNMNVIEFLNHMAYLKDRNKWQSAKVKQG